MADADAGSVAHVAGVVSVGGHLIEYSSLRNALVRRPSME
jgi:hypothetical protein